MRPSRTILHTALVFALTALVLGGLHAALEIGGRTWVLEFQAGPAADWSEKLSAVVQSAAIEALGFGLAGAALAAAALGLARVLPRLRYDDDGSGYGGALILCAGAFFGWGALAWLGNDALPLRAAQVIAPDALIASCCWARCLLRPARRAPSVVTARQQPNAVGTLAASRSAWAGLRS
jgi:hypothetical protein